MSITIQAPTTNGGHVELSGDAVGSFLLHRSLGPTFIKNDVKFLWCVTHVASGMKFPWQFYRKTAARSFAKDAEKLLDWSAVKVDKCDERTRGLKGKWVSGAPTKEQTEAIYKSATERGALMP